MTAVLSGIMAVALLFSMIALLEIGRRFGKRRLANDPEAASAGIGTVDGAIFALFGLLIAFTFSGAASRFDARRELIVEEANAIGTAWLRLDLLPEPDRAALKSLLREYLDSRLAVYSKLPNLEAARVELNHAIALQGEIWKRAVAASQAGENDRASLLLVPALNEMFDISTTRTMAAQIHPPMIIFVLLNSLGLGCAFLAGYGMAGAKERSWAHMVGFAAVIAVTVYVILDLEFPRLGLIRVDATDKVLIELREGMN